MPHRTRLDDRVLNRIDTQAAEGSVTPNAESTYDVARSDLPLSCPTPQMQLWNSHPRVYLPVEETGSAKCPYCGALYRLID